MFNAGLMTTVRESFDRVIATLGIPMVWNRTNAYTNPNDFLFMEYVNPDGGWYDPAMFPTVPPIQNESIVAGYRSLGKDDVQIANAYGAEAKIITLSISTINFVPVKFDTFTLLSGVILVVNACHNIYINDAHVGYKCFAVGK